MDEGIDISDLLEVDDRIAATWCSAEVEDGVLYLAFPNPGYEVDAAHLEGTTLTLDVYVEDSVLQKVKQAEIPVPEGVKRIVYGNITKE